MEIEAVDPRTENQPRAVGVSQSRLGSWAEERAGAAVRKAALVVETGAEHPGSTEIYCPGVVTAVDLLAAGTWEVVDHPRDRWSTVEGSEVLAEVDPSPSEGHPAAAVGEVAGLAGSPEAADLALPIQCVKRFFTVTKLYLESSSVCRCV